MSIWCFKRHAAGTIFQLVATYEAPSIEYLPFGPRPKYNTILVERDPKR
jgi:hypothetical protein